jgi:hypothetical protein
MRGVAHAHLPLPHTQPSQALGIQHCHLGLRRGADLAALEPRAHLWLMRPGCKSLLPAVAAEPLS